MFLWGTVSFWKTPSRGSSFLPKWGFRVVMLSDFKEMGFPWGKKEGNPTIASPQVENQICLS